MVIINGTSPPAGPQVQSHHRQGYDHTCVQYVIFSYYKGLLFVIILVFFTPFEERKSAKGTEMKLGRELKSWP